MAEYIDLDTPLEVYVGRGSFCKKQIATLRDLLDTNKIPYTVADARPVVRARWQYKTITIPGGKGQTYAKWCCTACKGKAKKRTNFCSNCGAEMKEE